MVQVFSDAEKYELRVPNTNTRIVGINDISGETFYSPKNNEATVATLSFSLKPHERLILWCRQQHGEQEAVATALFHRHSDGVFTIEASDGIDVCGIQPALASGGQMVVE